MRLEYELYFCVETTLDSTAHVCFELTNNYTETVLCWTAVARLVFARTALLPGSCCGHFSSFYMFHYIIASIIECFRSFHCRSDKRFSGDKVEKCWENTAFNIIFFSYLNCNICNHCRLRPQRQSTDHFTVCFVYKPPVLSILWMLRS